MGPRQKVAEGQAWRLLLTHLRWFIGWELLPWEGLAALRTSPNKSRHLQVPLGPAGECEVPSFQLIISFSRA